MGRNRSVCEGFLGERSTDAPFDRVTPRGPPQDSHHRQHVAASGQAPAKLRVLQSTVILKGRDGFPCRVAWPRLPRGARSSSGGGRAPTRVLLFSERGSTREGNRRGPDH